MSTRAFLGLVSTVIAVLLVMLLVEKYRECKEAGYTDCPRRAMWKAPKKSPADAGP